MKLVNPLHYPMAILAGGIALVVGVDFANMSSKIMLPVAATISIAGASFLKSREPKYFNLNNSELEREIMEVRFSALTLVNKANGLRLEAQKLLTDSFQTELLATVQISCDRIQELPEKIDNFAWHLQATNSLFSISPLQQQLTEVQQKLQSSSSLAKQHLSQLADSLKRNNQLAQEDQNSRLAQIVRISTLIQDYAGVFQRLHNQLHTSDLTESVQINQLQLLTDELSSLQDNIDLLVRK